MVFTIKRKLLVLGAISVAALTVVSALSYHSVSALRLLNSQASVTQANSQITQRMELHRQQLIEAIYAAQLTAEGAELSGESIAAIAAASEKLNSMTSRLLGREISYLSKAKQKEAQTLAQTLSEMGAKAAHLRAEHASAEDLRAFNQRVYSTGEALAQAQIALRDAVYAESSRIGDEVISGLEAEVQSIAVALGVALLTMLPLLGAIIYSISRPIRRMTDVMSQLAAGNAKVDVPCLSKHDEIGDIAKAVAIFKDNLLKKQRLADDFERNVKSIVNLVAAAAEELTVWWGTCRRAPTWPPVPPALRRKRRPMCNPPLRRRRNYQNPPKKFRRRF